MSPQGHLFWTCNKIGPLLKTVVQLCSWVSTSASPVCRSWLPWPWSWSWAPATRRTSSWWAPCCCQWTGRCCQRGKCSPHSHMTTEGPTLQNIFKEISSDMIIMRISSLLSLLPWFRSIFCAAHFVYFSLLQSLDTGQAPDNLSPSVGRGAAVLVPRLRAEHHHPAGHCLPQIFSSKHSSGELRQSSLFDYLWLLWFLNCYDVTISHLFSNVS